MLARLVCVGQSGISVRRVGGNRAGEMRFTRFLRNRNSQSLALMGTAIYEITHEDHLPLGVSKNTFDLGIVELVQQAMQSVSVTMNVTDEIVSLNSH